ncbi:tetratricopeptide repeat protein [uncultured Zobellia sp.]|uniref:tetratricopeptide repeat protein n=1 Tax=uncultured Zobellia sp. TaxID=255433 RepID=UPI002594FBD1|nr:tetratricopeptide repeat protein [uncultured Zobellia sp.]
MAAFKEENAITYRIEKMRKQWSKSVQNDTQLIKWSVNQDEVRMVQAFSLLEGSENGKLPEFFLNFQVPFSNKESYAKDLTEFWLQLWNSTEARKEVESRNVLPDWDDAPFKNITEKDNIPIFLKCMSSFTRAIFKRQVLVLNIMPLAYDRNPEFREWVFECAKAIPENLRLMIYDVADFPIFEKIPREIDHVTISPDLEMGKAMREMLTAGSGAGSQSALDINVCLFNMADALKDKDVSGVHHWGKEAVKIGKKLKNKSLEATAYLAYGSGLFQLRKTDDAIQQYEAAEKISKQGIEEQDVTAPTLLLQSYNFLASLYYYKKKREKAAAYYKKTAEAALDQNNLMVYLESSRLGAEMMRKTGERKKAFSWLKKAYENGQHLPVETQKFSSMLLLCQTLEDFAEDYNEKKLTGEIDKHASKIWGNDWRELAKGKTYKNLMTPQT